MILFLQSVEVLLQMPILETRLSQTELWSWFILYPTILANLYLRFELPETIILV